jgi:Flp pilus assembly pilin Flp
MRRPGGVPDVRETLYLGAMTFRRGRGRESGQGTVEYGLLIASCAILVIVSVLFFAGGVGSLFERAGTAQDPPPIFTPPVATCDPSYDGVCVPPAPPDLDCDDLEGMGIPLPVTVVGDDPHGLDENGDGLGCAE